MIYTLVASVHLCIYIRRRIHGRARLMRGIVLVLPARRIATFGAALP